MKTNIEFFKLADPIVQSLLFLLFAYFIGGDSPYYLPLLLLAAWQLFSWIINLFVHTEKLLKTKRLIWLVTAIIYLTFYFYVSKHIPEQYIEVRDATGLVNYPLHEIILISLGLAVAFWYFFICFWEVRRILKKINANK